MEAAPNGGIRNRRDWSSNRTEVLLDGLRIRLRALAEKA